MAKFCMGCGRPLQEGENFCTGCGRRVEPSPAVPNGMRQGAAPPSMHLPPPPFAYPHAPMPAQRSSGNAQTFIIIGVVILALAAIGGAAYQFLSDRPAPRQTQPRPAQPQQAQTPRQTETVQASSPEAAARLAAFVREKDDIDIKIGETANRLNQHLGRNPNFRGADYLKNDTKNVLDRVEQNRRDLQALNVGAADREKKEALLRLFALEGDRIRGLYKGVVDSQNGGDYSLGFQSGTQASYAFDDANTAFRQRFPN